MSLLKFYWNLSSQPARSVKTLLDLGKVKHQLVSLNLRQSETRGAEYLAVNPLGQVPYIVDKNFRLAQSNAILVYLCQKYPTELGKYYGSTSQERAIINQHLSWYQSYFRPALFKKIELRIYQAIKKQVKVYESQLETADKAQDEAMRDFQNILKRNNFKFIAGNHVTIADFQLFYEITNFIVYEKKFDEYALIDRWYKNVSEIEQVKNIQNEWSKISPIVCQTLKSAPILKSKL